MPGQEVTAVACRLRAGGIAAHIGTALLFGHRHSNGQPVLFSRGNGTGVIFLRSHARLPKLRQFRSRSQRRDTRVSHGHWAGYTGIRLGHQKHHRPVKDVTGGFAAPCAPGNPVRQAQGHQVMVGGMELDFVQALAVAIKGLQARRIRVRLVRPFAGLHGAASLAEFRKAGMVCSAATGFHSIAQCRVRSISIDIGERRRLIGHYMGCKLRHGLSIPHDQPPCGLVRSTRNRTIEIKGIRTRRC